MKKLFTAIFIFISFATQAQDSAFVRNITMPARAWEYLAGIYSLPLTPKEEDFFIDLKNKFRVVTPPQNLQNVTLDSAEIETVVKIYQFIKNVRIAEGEDILAAFKTGLVTPRANNPTLNTYINDIEAAETGRLQSTRAFGRARLIKVRN